MSKKNWLSIAAYSLLTFAGVLFFGFGLAFNPGWANGWPFGMTIHAVWSTGMTFLFFVLVMSFGAGIGAIACAGSAHFDLGLRSKTTAYAYAIWLLFCGVAALCACIWVYREIYASTLVMWPNGYPN